jgi:hypothetical protein
MNLRGIFVLVLQEPAEYAGLDRYREPKPDLQPDQNVSGGNEQNWR